jgi:Xaa-Pro aminopeptidase
MRRTGLGLTASVLLASLAAASAPIDRTDYARRRAALYAKMAPGSAVLILTGDIIKDEEFHYFAGVSVKGSAFFALKNGPVEYLFLPPHRPSYGISEDAKPSPGPAAEAETGIAHTVPNTEIEKTMTALLKGVGRLYVNKLMDRPDPLGVSDTPQAALLKKLQAAHPGLTVEDDFFLASEVRGIKTPAEIERVREAVSVCGRGVMEAMRLARPGLYEHNLEAAAGYVFRSAGARTSFAIVGSGPNSIILHHRTNDRRLDAGDLVVLDIGAEVDHYGSDITRTFPVSGTFTEEQRKVYAVVLEANKRVIAAAKPGVPVEELDKLARSIIEEAGYGKYFNHGVSHPINMGGMGPLAPGMIITVEPGIYLPEKGFGVRIEDDVLITPEGNAVLSAGVPKEIADVERLMAGKSPLESLD